MSDRPLVSIVTPSYNQACFLRRTIDSVLTQTYSPIEYVVIDGGSTDGSVAILRSYGERLTWTSERDRCQAEAINKGFARSHGSIRAFLNSDDVLLPDAVQKVVDFFLRHPDCDMLYGRAHYIDEHNAILGFYPTKDFSFDELKRDCFICQPAAFWRTEIAEHIGPFNESLKNAIDYHYWLRMARLGGRMQHVPDVLACSRLHKDMGTLTRRHEFYQDILKACLEETGGIEETHFHGLWHHLCHEKKSGWPFNLRRLPRFYERMAFLHYQWCRNGKSVVRFARDTIRALLGRLRRHNSRRRRSELDSSSQALSYLLDASRCPIPMIPPSIAAGQVQFGEQLFEANSKAG